MHVYVLVPSLLEFHDCLPFLLSRQRVWSQSFQWLYVKYQQSRDISIKARLCISWPCAYYSSISTITQSPLMTYGSSSLVTGTSNSPGLPRGPRCGKITQNALEVSHVMKACAHAGTCISSNFTI